MEIWVTKSKIKNGDGENVEWMKLMDVAVPKCKGKASIYIAKGDKFYEIRIQELVDFHPRHCTYFPSLVPVHMGANNELTFTMSGMGKTEQVRSHFTLPRRVEASNGVGENEWDDGFFNNVKKISVGRNHFGIVFVKFDYSNDNTVVAGAAHGNPIQILYDDLPIADDDYLEAVEGTYNIDSHITSLTFRLHKRNMTHQFGLKNGMPFVLRGGKGSKIIGFYGRSSDVHLTALGVHLFASV